MKKTKTKYDFIADLLETQKINHSQKKQFLKMVIYELNKDFLDKEEIKKRLIEKEIERKISINENKNESGNKKKPNPKHVADFMSLFNRRDGFKYLTHDYDEDGEFDILKYLEDSKKIFNEKTKKLSIPKSLYKLTEQFAFDPNPKWKGKDVNYEDIELGEGWSLEKWKEWSKENQLHHPIRHDKFCNVINSFRRITRIEKPNLEIIVNKCIDYVFKSEKNEFQIIIKDLDKADLYTHVGFFINALKIIFEEIKQRSDSKDKKHISIRFERESIDDYFLRKIIIHHKNSYPTKELGILNKEWREGKGNMGNIEKKLAGYCHWSVETKIEDKPIRINILKDDITPEYEENILNAQGFTHILVFYYK